MSEGLFTTHNLWILIATVLVFIMHLGFASLEAGFVRKKNTVNILFKNAMIISIGLLTYFILGYGLMYPGGDGGGFFGFAGIGVADPGTMESMLEASAEGFTLPSYTDFIFQAMFAATCATIVSGAVAERIKLGPFLIFTTIFVAISYPITGMWKWGGGWLDVLGFYDFAGSTLVHAVGGFAALAGIILLGARKGKYTKKGIKPIPGHSMPFNFGSIFVVVWMVWIQWRICTFSRCWSRRKSFCYYKFSCCRWNNRSIYRFSFNV